jgi:hypothetical protein
MLDEMAGILGDISAWKNTVNEYGSKSSFTNGPVNMVDGFA